MHNRAPISYSLRRLLHTTVVEKIIFVQFIIPALTGETATAIRSFLMKDSLGEDIRTTGRCWDHWQFWVFLKSSYFFSSKKLIL